MAVTREEVAKLYVATFNRAPDATGLDYWVNSGMPIEDIASSFFDQPETQALYGTTISDYSAFVNAIYNNLFNRDAEEGGLEYWVNELETGSISQSNMILAIVNGAQDSYFGSDATILDNKLEVGLAYADADAAGELEFFVEDARAVMDGVDHTQGSVDVAMDEIEAIIADQSSVGETYDLTTDIDSISGTSADDTINGTIITKDTLGHSTFQSADTINGADGQDTINVTIDGANDPFGPGHSGEDSFIAPQMTSVETMDIREYDAATYFDMTDVSGLETIALSGWNSRNDFWNVQNTVDFEHEQAFDTDSDVTFSMGALVGDNDTVNVSVKDSWDIDLDLDTYAYMATLENLDITTSGMYADIDVYVGDNSTLAVENLDITTNAAGYSDVNVYLDDAATETIDITANGQYADIDVDAIGTGTTNVNVTTGADSIYSDIDVDVYGDGAPTATVVAEGYDADVDLEIDGIETVTVEGAGTYLDLGVNQHGDWDANDALSLIDATAFSGDLEIETDLELQEQDQDVTILGGSGPTELDINVDMFGYNYSDTEMYTYSSELTLTTDTQDSNDIVDIDIDNYSYTYGDSGIPTNSAIVNISTNGGADYVDLDTWGDGLELFDATVDLGDGDDELRLDVESYNYGYGYTSDMGTVNVDVDSGAGNDELWLDIYTDYGTVELLDVNVNAGSENDLVDLEMDDTYVYEADVNVDAGTGDDRVELDIDSSYIADLTLTLDGGDGDDTLAMEGFVAEWLEDVELTAEYSDDSVTNFETLALTDVAWSQTLDLSTFGTPNLTLEEGADGGTSWFTGMQNGSTVTLGDDIWANIDLDIKDVIDSDADTLNLVLDGTMADQDSWAHDIDMGGEDAVSATDYETINVTSLGMDELGEDSLPIMAGENELNLDAASMTTMNIDGDYAIKIDNTFGDTALINVDGSTATGNIDLSQVVYDTTADLRTITTGSGDDVIKASTGIDLITGGAGADEFQFDALDSWGAVMDTITDFVSGTDTINTTDIILAAFVGNTVGLAAANSALQLGTVDAAYDTVTGQIYIDVDASGDVNDNDMIIQLDGVAGLTFEDFTDLL